MVEIKDLLNKFNDLLLSEQIKIESVRKAIFFVVGIDIKPEDIKIKNNVLYLNIKPLYKNEIFIKKEKILSKLEELFGKKTPRNIR